MKKLTAIILAAVLFGMLLPMPVLATDEKPVIALTDVPPYGSGAHVEGVVFREDGETVDAGKYRISLYLQIYDGGEYWVKPTYAMPYAELEADGSFSLAYATGGEDRYAKSLYIMLIPASYTPGVSFAQTRNLALDTVKVSRSASGTVTVSPKREAPVEEPTEQKLSGLSPWGEKIGVNVGFYTDGSQPGDSLSLELIRRQLVALRDYADTVRFYEAGGETAKAYPLAHTLGFSVVGTAWLSGNKERDAAELDALIEQCEQGYVKVACVGSETLLRGDLTAEELMADMAYVRERLNDKTIPVTTAESVDILLNAPGLRKACDILMPNCYPYWSGCSVSDAVSEFSSSLSALREKTGGKEIVVSETGWPTAGQTIGNAVPGEREAKQFFEAVCDWSENSQTPVLWFDGADEPWKAWDEGECGAHWGLLTKELTPKSFFTETDFYREAEAKVGIHRFERKQSYPAGLFRDVTAKDWFADNIPAVYEYGLMIGQEATAFAPKKQISTAEITALAVRLYDGCRGAEDTHTGGEKWYDGYVEYAEALGLIREGQFSTFSRPATRAEVAVLLAAAIPEKALPSIHPQRAVPDVSPDAPYAEELYRLYRAGILTGNDAAGNFQPERPITRAEVAALVTRLIDPSLRK